MCEDPVVGRRVWGGSGEGRGGPGRVWGGLGLVVRLAGRPSHTQEAETTGGWALSDPWPGPQ